EDLLACRDCDPSSKRLQFQSGTRLMMQLLRTQAQVGQPKTNRKHKDDVGDYEAPVRDIQSGYMVAANNVTQFIYIENQYFRWPPLPRKRWGWARSRPRKCSPAWAGPRPFRRSPSCE
ncbi:phospholipase D/transphosphatidylase, partial [Pseudomonas syringae pv. actinidiae ICMP 19071]